MPIRVTCPGCQSILEVKDGLAGHQGGCPKCGGVIQVPAGGAGGTAQKLLHGASAMEMVEELSRRKRSAVLVVFETPESESYELNQQPGADVHCYRTADMNDAQLMQVLQELGSMSQGQRTDKGGVGLGADGRPQPFELKGDRLGTSLEDPLRFIWRNKVSSIELVRGTIRPKRPSMLHFVHGELYQSFQGRAPSRSEDL